MAKLILEGDPGVCPVCKEDVLDLCDEYEDGKHLDSYVCRPCGLIVTFITPDTKSPYHEYSRMEIEIETTMPRVYFDLDDDGETVENGLVQKVREMQAENARLRDALAWYADEANNHREIVGEDGQAWASAVAKDGGLRAAQALAGQVPVGYIPPATPAEG